MAAMGGTRGGSEGALVLGPLLRYVDTDSATVWVETENAAVVTVEAGDQVATARTFKAHGHHYALVEVTGTSSPLSSTHKGQLVGGVWTPLSPMLIETGGRPTAEALRVSVSSSKAGRSFEHTVIVPVGPRLVGGVSLAFEKQSLADGIRQLAPYLARPVVIDGNVQGLVSLRADGQSARACLATLADHAGGQVSEENGALKVTTALFFRPGGHSTQHSGVGADVVLPSLLASDDYGEKTQRFSLPPQQTSPFLGTSANGEDEASHWLPVGSDTMAFLAERSRLRIAEDEAFVEIRERLARDESSEENVRALVGLALERGGTDNVTAVVGKTRPRVTPPSVPIVG